MDIVDSLFVSIFDGLNERCKKELATIGRQYPFKPLKVLIFSFIYFIIKLLSPLCQYLDLIIVAVHSTSAYIKHGNINFISYK